MIRAVTSPYAGALTLPEDIIFCDLTLREGEQSPGVTYTIEEKFELLRRLDDLGIDQIQLPIPGANPELLDLCKRFCEMGLRAKTEIMTAVQRQNWKEQIDAANSCGPDIIHAGFEISEYNAPVWNEEVKAQLLTRIVEAVDYIKATKKRVNVSLTDATRAEFTFLMQCIETAAKAGADRIRIADSFGVGTPEGMAMAVSNAVRIAEPYGAIIGVHCHNDFGLALANTFASIRAGAKLIDLCANGMGDRAGNACLIEAMISLETLYKQPTGMKVEKATEFAKFVERISGVAIAPSKPFLGANVFAEEQSGHAIEQFERPVKGRALVPEDIGGKLSVVYGKLTNERVIELSAQAAGRKIDKQYYPAILAALAEKAEESKGVPLYEADFWAIVDSIVK